MAFILATSFFKASQKLSNEEQGRVMSFVSKFLENPALPSHSLERVQQAKSDNLWSARVSKELRAIAVKDGEDWALVHVDHHDEAYRWTELRSVERHSRTGELQIVELPTTLISQPEPKATRQRALFDRYDNDYLLSLGVPETWLPVIRQVGSEDELIEIAARLSVDVADRLFDVASGKLVTPPVPFASLTEAADQTPNLFVVRSQDELRPLLDAPMAQWIAFLHPTQKKLATGNFNGAVKITGSAGTGKTVVAMHRARHLARQGKRVLLTSYVNNLCHNLRRNLQLFCSDEELQRVEILTVHHLAKTLLEEAGESWSPLNDENLLERLTRLTDGDCPLDSEALFAEWRNVIESQGMVSWEQYRNASRAGRGRPLTIKDRKAVWTVVERFHRELREQRECSFSGLCLRALELIAEGGVVSPYDAVIVDEVQDLGMPELRLLATLAGAGANRLMLAGDGGQRIYPGKSSLKSLGIDVRGRSHVLRLNYRTTEQIRRFADAVLGEDEDDLEGGKQSRASARSLLSGPQPILKEFDSRPAQCDYVAEQIGQFIKLGRTPDEIAVFARQAYLLEMMETRLRRSGIPFHRLNKDGFPSEPMVSLGSMHRAKGLEFKFVFVIDVSDEQLPYAKALNKKTDEIARQEFLELERQLLYVSLTRARDCVSVTWVGRKSRFLEP